MDIKNHSSQLDRIETLLLELCKNNNNRSVLQSPFYTEDEVCKVLGIRKPTLHHWRNKGRIPHYKIAGSRVYCYDKKEIETFIRNNHSNTEQMEVEQ